MQLTILSLFFILLPLLASAQVQLVADVSPGPGSTDPSDYQALNGKLYFSATTTATGEELYVYDPITRQTNLAADLIEGAEGSAPFDLVAANGKLYFLASKVFNPYFIGRQLYTVLYEYDPVTGQIRLINEFTGIGSRGVELSSNPQQLLVLDTKIYILRGNKPFQDPYNVVEVYDPIADTFINRFSVGLVGDVVLAVLDGKVYARNDDGIVTYDPAAGSTSEFDRNIEASLPSGSQLIDTTVPTTLFPFSSKLYYAASIVVSESLSPPTESPGVELYSFDPATQTEILVADINPGDASSNPREFAAVEGKLYFQANNGTTGSELFVYDPVTDAVTLAADLTEDNTSSTPVALFAFENDLYFSAQTTALGRELYRYDPGMGTTALVADLAPDTLSSNPGSFSIFEDELYFSATAPATGREVWKLGETPAFTLALIDAEQDQVITTLNSDSSIDLAALNLVGYNIEANVGDTVTRVDFQLKGPLSINISDTDAPYSLFGEEQGDFNAQQPQAGDYVLTVTPFSQKNGNETAGEPITVIFSLVADDLSVLNPRLVRVPGGESLDSLQNGEEIYLAELPQEFGVVADAVAGSVLFALTGAETINTIQNTAPLALFDKQNGQLIGSSLTPGAYTLTVTPYSRSEGQGYAGEPLIINFTVNGNPFREVTIAETYELQDITGINPIVVEGSTVIASINLSNRLGEEYYSDVNVYDFNTDSISLAKTDEYRRITSYYTFSLGAPAIAIDEDLVVLGYSDSFSEGKLGIYQLQSDNSLSLVQTIAKEPIANLVVATDGQRILLGGNDDLSEEVVFNTLPFRKVFIYQQINGRWQETDSINTPGITDLAIEGNTILLGASGRDDSFASGKVLVYSLTNGEWTLTQTLTPEDSQSGDRFGDAVVLQDNRAVIGASGSESAYVFELQGGQWVQTARLKASDAGGNDLFGASVALDGPRAVVGAPASREKKGSAYVFKLVDEAWTPVARLVAGRADESDFYGTTVDISGKNVAIGTSGTEGFVYELIDSSESVPTPRIPSIASVTLINTDNDEDQVIVESIEDGQEISLRPGDVYEYTLVANVATAGQRIRRVVLDLEAPAGQSRLRTEYAEPYALFGDVRGNVRGQKPYAGQYKLVATPYYMEQDQEVAGESKTINFTLTTGGLEASNLRVVNARDGSLVESLEDGDVLALSPEQAVTIVADVLYPQFNSLQFDLQGPLSLKRTENFTPYAIFGDVKGVLAGKVLPAGQYHLSVIPFLGKNRDAYAGPEVKVSFMVVAQGSNNSEALAYPVPFESELNLRTGSLDLSQVRIELVHGYGKVYLVAASQVSQSPEGLRLQLRSDLPAGPYTLRIISQGQLQTFRVSKQ